MKIICYIFCFFLFVIVGCTTDKTRENQTDDVREAVFRWQFAHNASGQKQGANFYFLEVGEKADDATDEFIERFSDQRPRVRNGSACTWRNGRVVDKQSGKWGLIFRITKMTWKSDAEVEVIGGYYEAELSASGNIYTVRKIKGKWVVTNDKMDWIS